MFDFKNIISEKKAKGVDNDTSTTDGSACTCSNSEAISGKRSTRERPLNLDLGSDAKYSSLPLVKDIHGVQKGYDWQLSGHPLSAGRKRSHIDRRALVTTDDFGLYDPRHSLSRQPQQHEPRGLTSSGSSLFASPDDPEEPDDLKPAYTSLNGEKRELTPFERANLLFIQELKAKQKQALRDLEKQVHDLPNLRLRQSLSHPGCEADLYRCYSDESTPRSGSPFPRRKEFPATAFSPSKTARSQALRSLSLEEEVDDDLDEDNLEDEIGWRKNNSDFLGFSRIRGERKLQPCPTPQPSPADTWWNNLGSSPLNSPSLQRKASPSTVSYTRSSATPTPAQSPFKDVNVNFQPGIAKQKFSFRSYSSPAGTGNQRTFAPLDLSMSFANFHSLPKCRPELEDVGGNFSSILSTSPEDNTRFQRAMLPTTQEAAHEDLSDEDISRKKSQTEAKSPHTSGPHLKPTSAAAATLTPTPTATTTKSPPTSAPSDIVPSAISESPQNGKTEPAAQKPSPAAETKKPTPMAFTIELDSAASDSSTSGNSAKKLDITASLSQWAPKHRRNLSLTKVEEHKKVEERQGNEKPPLGRPRSGTVGAGPPLGPKRVGAGYHSEGYFSSDQDDEAPKRTDLKSPRSPRTPETSHPPPPVLVRSNSQDSSKGNSIRKQGSKPEGRACCKERERKPSVSELTGKSYKSDKKMVSDSKKQTKNSPTEEADPSKEDKDDVSEAGTYTIDKDSPSPEEDQARNNIDGVFGVPTESEAELTSTTTTAVPVSTTDHFQEDESSWMSASEIPPSISRNSPNWIQQWAAHVAEQTKPQIEPVLPLPKPSVTSPRGQKLLNASHENDSRPRRKLPTPPSHINSPSALSPRADPASFANHRFWRDKTVNSDLTSDTEAYLRDTENLVSSLQARVDKTKGENSAFRNASFESHESGADSDFDTSFSYPFNDDDRMAPSLKSKLRLTGLLPASKNLPNPSTGVVSPRRPESGTVKDPKLKKSRGVVGVRDPTYDIYTQKRDDRGLHSDSSSEASEPYKDLPRTNDKNPPLKFNRAFSLRRARLGCEDPVPTQSLDKKKISRPSSAGAAVSTRKAAVVSNKSYQSVDSPSVSSPRSCGFGSPRGIASSSQSVGSKGTPHSDNFDRTDGGRFSLRLARTGSSTISTVKSPSKNSLKKEPPTHKKNATRSNSTLSSKEVDFQNWKRRKNYDPMKAAAEGRKKHVDEKKIKGVPPTAQSTSENRSPSPPGSLLRSASFHGTEGVMSNLRWTRKACNNHHPQYTSEDDGPYSLEEEIGPHPSPRHGSPLHRSPTSPHQLCQSPARQHAPPTPRGRRPSLGHSDEGDPQYQSSLRKRLFQISLDESGSEGKRSPLNGGTRGAGNPVSGAGRPKTKMEALDNLVISTIHSLSVKVRSTSESLLQKLKSHFDEEGDRAALLEEVLSHLSESDQSLASGQTRSTSRELAGILRNLKKIEHALEVIDRVIIVGEEEYREDDIDYVPTEWVEVSDY